MIREFLVIRSPAYTPQPAIFERRRSMARRGPDGPAERDAERARDEPVFFPDEPDAERLMEEF
jgi:hypothetical protein